MVITIARECGSGGHAVASSLAKDFGIELFDKRRLMEEAKALHQYEENRNFIDETPINSLLYSLALGYGDDSLQKRSFQLVKDMTAKKDLVIIGHCSNYIFKDEEDVTTIFIHADEEIRIQRLMKKHDLNEKKARELMKKYDDRRASFQKYCTGQHWGIAKHYQLTIDSGHIGIKGTVKMIKQYIEYKKNILQEDKDEVQGNYI
ncbi:MAG: AAA family ATPase [Anaerostipes sp.]